MSKYKYIFLAIFILYVSGCAGPSKEIKQAPLTQIPAEDESKYVTVEAESLIAPIKDNILATKEQSLMAAQRAALEKALGVFISAQTIVQQAALLEENIFSRTAGYIKDYKILSEGPDGEFYKTKISAKVKMGDISKEIDVLGLLIKSKKVGNPRVMVLINEEIDGIKSTQSIAETIIIKKLLDLGYRVVDQEQIAKIKQDEEVVKALSGDANSVAKVGKKFDAEVIISGTAISKFNTDQGLAGMISYRAVLDAKVLKVSTGDLLLASTPKQGAGIDVTKEMAAKNSIIKLTTSIAEEIVPQIAPKLYESSSIKLVVNGIPTLNKLSEFNNTVRYLDGVSAIYVRSFEGNTAQLELELKFGNTQTLAAKLEALKDWNMQVKETAGNLITMEVKNETK